MTQLVGRILRQPYAKKTGIPELDESYVFFASGHVQEVLDHVKNGFEEEGLGDVAAGIEVRDAGGQVLKAPRAVRIKKNILQKYPESLYLPVWLVKNGKQTRRFSYDTDIKPSIDWDAAEIETWLKELLPTIGKSKKTQLEMIVGLEGQKQARETTVNESVRFDTLYLTRRLSETVENAFVAYDIAKQVFAILSKEAEQDVLDSDAGYIARELEKHLRAHQKTQEEIAFAALLKNGKMELAISDDPAIGYTMPDTDIIESSLGSSYSLTLYEDVDPSSLNTLESGVARYIEQSHNVLWWTRNKVGHGWYAIQGWQRGKIRPDFIIARKNERNELEFVYVVESKGEQLMGNADTEYKDAVFNRINGMNGKIAQVRTRLTTMKLNDRFDFELIPQGEEERRLRNKL
jgi:type III restriction enzyme